MANAIKRRPLITRKFEQTMCRRDSKILIYRLAIFFYWASRLLSPKEKVEVDGIERVFRQLKMF